MKTIITRSTGLLALVVLFGVAQTTHAQNVVETAQGVDDLSTLVELVVSADLADTLSNAEDITVFAPTNDAFEKLPNVLFRAIENDPDILVSILTYHVAPERLRAEDVIETRRIGTLQGTDIIVRTPGNNVFLNSSQVTATDIETDNATVHTINKVLIPWRDILRDVIQALRHK
jgi:uncharacterized surface protein with fasciclin (FAS1) repeats